MEQEEAEQEEARERRIAECEFVSSAYAPDEAWVDDGNNNNNNILVYRRLCASTTASSSTSTAATTVVNFLVVLNLPLEYPVSGSLNVTTVKIEVNGTTNPVLMKCANNAIPSLQRVCCNAASATPGEESIFTVFSAAEEWLRDVWPTFLVPVSTNNNHNTATTAVTSSTLQQHQQQQQREQNVVWCQMLIYSHHIIGSKKRSDMKDLTAELQLTGYCKIGWPGIIIVEGFETSCQEFYRRIRRWTWQYLTLRGTNITEISTTAIVDNGSTHTTMDDFRNEYRKFPTFIETDDMSVVADHCRTCNLESLFRTSMKIYDDNDNNDNDTMSTLDNGGDGKNRDTDDSLLYGALVHVDHMNDGKSYRKWLRKTCFDFNVALLIQQCYKQQDYNDFNSTSDAGRKQLHRPLILVGMIGSKDAISTVLKKWRTSFVDVDTRNQPCRERMISMLVENQKLDIVPAATKPSSFMSEWENLSSEGQVNTTHEKMLDTIQRTGIPSWTEAITLLLKR